MEITAVGLGLYYPPILQNPKEKNMENEMDTDYLTIGNVNNVNLPK